MNNRLKRLLAAVLIVILPLNALPASASEITLVHPDHLGSPVAYTDIDGNVIGREYYTPYGESLNPPTTDDTVSYTGHVRDGDTGLLYMQARYYDPEIGRFLSVDPVTFSPDQPQQFNRYWYANGNPYAYVDPDGGNAIRVGQLALRGGLMVGAVAYTAVDDDLQAMLPDPTSTPSATETVVLAMVAETLDAIAGSKVLSEEESREDADGDEGRQNKKGDEKRLSSGEVKKLEEAGMHPHDLKPNSKYDLFKDKDGNIIVKPKSGEGPGEPTGINIDDLK